MKSTRYIAIVRSGPDGTIWAAAQFEHITLRQDKQTEPPVAIIPSWQTTRHKGIRNRCMIFTPNFRNLHFGWLRSADV
jgi:hypothetical protein